MFLYCAAGETRTHTRLPGLPPQSSVSTIPPLPHICLWGWRDSNSHSYKEPAPKAGGSTIPPHPHKSRIYSSQRDQGNPGGKLARSAVAAHPLPFSTTWLIGCGRGRTRTSEARRRGIYSPLQLPLCDSPNSYSIVTSTVTFCILLYLSSSSLSMKSKGDTPGPRVWILSNPFSFVIIDCSGLILPLYMSP